MIRVLDRLVLLTFLRTFALSMLVAPILFVVGDIASELDTYIDRGLTGSEVARAYIFQLPLFLSWSFPIAALLATVFTVHGMTMHREIVAAKSGGISFHRMVLPLIVAGVGLFGAAAVLAEIVPRTNRVAGHIVRAQTFTDQFRADFVVGSDNGLGWQVSRLTAADGNINGLVLARPPSPESNGVHVVADRARWKDDEGWLIEHGFLRVLLPDSSERAAEFETLRMASATESPEDLLDPPLEPEEMTYAEAGRFAAQVTRTGGSADEILVEREQRVSLAFATLVILLFGAPLATSTERGGAAYGIGLSLATVLLYLLLFRFAGTLGQAGAISPLMAAWAPNAAFLVAGVVLLARART